MRLNLLLSDFLSCFLLSLHGSIPIHFLLLGVALLLVSRKTCMA